MIISHNTAALVTNNALAKANVKADKASKRLSTGYKINTAADDAAGLAIANKMRSQIKSLQMADRNCNDAISLIQTTEAGLAEVSNMVLRLRELAVEGASDTVTNPDREKIQVEVSQLVDEIDKTSEKVLYNNKPLFSSDITDSNPFVFQVGAYEGITIEFDMESMDAASLGLAVARDNDLYKTNVGCGASIELCDAAIAKISQFRAKLGALQNRLDYTSSALQISDENAQESLSRIVDSDMATEMSSYTTYNVITQAGISMLAQANQRPNQILSLLQ